MKRRWLAISEGIPQMQAHTDMGKSKNEERKVKGREDKPWPDGQEQTKGAFQRKPSQCIGKENTGIEGARSVVLTLNQANLRPQ